MAMVTKSTSSTTLSNTLSSFEDNHNNLRTASFSFYLNGTDESFVLKLAESSPIYMERKKAEDSEIDVFGAERYFSGRMEEESTPRIANKSARTYPCKEDDEQTQSNLDPIKPKIQPATPSVRSESSWNSQSALLQSVLRNNSFRNKANKAQGRSFFSSLGCKCYCSDKDSIDIDETAKAFTNEPVKSGLNSIPIDAVQISKPRSESWVKEKVHYQKFDKLGGVKLNKENHFTTSPIISYGVGNMPIKLQSQEDEVGVGDEANDKRRQSLEVFGSSILDKRNKSLTLERRLTKVSSWDAATRGVEEINILPTSGEVYNDAESDASSDLFEIESLSSKYNPFLTRQPLDSASGYLTPTTCYAPSEASIEWSVVTASAADFSVMSDYDERIRPGSIVPSPNRKVVATTTATAKPAANKEVTRRRPNILLGCKSQKAVRVAGEAYRTNDHKTIFDPQMRHNWPPAESFTPVTRFQADAKMIGFDSKNGQRAFTTRLIPWTSEPARASHLLFF